MKKSKAVVKSEPALGWVFSPTKNLIGYAVIFFAAMLFTQALRSTLSNIFFVFIMLVPLAMIGYVFLARSALSVYKISDSQTVEKLDEVTSEFRLINDGIFPYPFIDAYISLPQMNSVRTRERCVKISMPPKNQYDIKNTVKFRFRGSYKIGVRCLYVYDFFRLFRLRVDFDNYDDIYVLPRKLFLDDGEARAMSDSADFTMKSPFSHEKIEISDIRDYRMGDSLKSIHWKLSSKSEEFVVRDFDTGTSKMTLVYADLSARFPEAPSSADTEKAEEALPENADGASVKTERADKKRTRYDSDPDIAEVSEEQIDARMKARADALRRRRERQEQREAKKKKKNAADITARKEEQPVEVPAADVNLLAKPEYYEDMNEYCADGVVELAVAEVLRELRLGNICTLLWFDSRSESGACAYTVRGMADFEMVFRLFATAPLCDSDQTVARLGAMVRETQNMKQLFVTSAIDAAAVSELCGMPCVGEGTAFGAAEVVLYNPLERFANQWERRVYVGGCREQLSEHGMKLTEADPTGLRRC